MLPEATSPLKDVSMVCCQTISYYNGILLFRNECVRVQVVFIKNYI